jgi:uncharacterized membrane protein YphA (DoxX/SURF4 family)
MKKICILWLRLITGAFFGIAGVAKLVAFNAFLLRVENFRIVPAELIPIVGIAVPGIEVGLGCALITGLHTRRVAAALGILTMLLQMAIVSVLVRGMQIECGCFGSLVRARIGFGSMAKGIFLILSCFFLWKEAAHPFSIDSLLRLPARSDSHRPPSSDAHL